VAAERDETVKKAEKLLKQGKLAAAIEEYVRLVEDNPGDWNSANALGDLYVKAGETERAAALFTRAADHLYGEGFFPRASAVYKKVLKVRSGDDHTLWQLADIAGRNGIARDARSHYTRLIEDRRAAGNEQGAVDCIIRLGLLDDASIDAKRTAAAALIERGERKQAAPLILGVADALAKEGRLPDAVYALREAVPLDPDNQEIQAKLAELSPSDQVVEQSQSAATIVAPPAIDQEPEPVTAVAAVVETVADPPEITITTDTATLDAATLLESVTADPAVASAGLTVPPAPAATDDLPLESFFEDLRGRVAREQEVRARQQFEEGVRHLEENRRAEAMASLEEASRTPALRFEAASHLSRIHLGRGDLSTAVEWMERALEAPAPTTEDRIGLMYDLADTLTKQGENSRAMALLIELESESPDYEDVRERIVQLSQTEIGNP
jgi:tetratricopeptide (TPR) repeat protein